jgi:predicted GNAT superfamily acetyltransferase
VSDAVLAEAGLTIQPLDSLTRVCAAEDLLAHIWQTTGTPPLTADVMRAVEHAGGYVVGVYADTRLVGASAGFLAMGADGRVRLHSHISGLLREVQGRQVGWALKQHQRDWALSAGSTASPGRSTPAAPQRLVQPGQAGGDRGGVPRRLLRRDARQRQRRRAQRPRLLPLGPALAGCRDGLPGAGQWCCRPATCPLVLDERDGWPSRAQEGAPAGPVRLRLPADVERLRNQQPEAARAWRAAVRQLLGPLLDAGRRTDGMTADAELVVGAAPASGAAPDSGPAG